MIIKLISTHKNHLLFGVLLAAAPLAAQAQNIGFVELSYSYNDASDTPYSVYSTSDEFELRGAYAFNLNENGTIIAEGSVNFGSHSDDIFWGAGLAEPQYEAGLHYLHTLNSGTIVGAFAAYGNAPREDEDESYQTAYGGVEVVHPLNEKFALYAQAAYVTSLDNESNSSYGYDNGYVIRAGVGVNVLQNTLLKAEFEYGGSENYEDEGEAGEFFSYYLGAETSFGSQSSFTATYGLRFATYAALGDSDFIEELTANVGVRYTFGDASASGMLDAGLIGLPYLPLRATYWTPGLD